MVAFGDGEVFLKSLTFERVLVAARTKLQAATDREAIDDALDVGALWPDRLNVDVSARVLRAVVAAAVEITEEDRTASDQYDDRSLEILQLDQLVTELARRYS